MHRATVAQQLPIHPSRVHFIFEGRQLLFRHQRVGGAVHDQHRALDVLGVGRVRRIQGAVERNRSLERCTGASQFQGTATTKTEAERGQV
jgi:hypothetical protein